MKSFLKNVGGFSTVEMLVAFAILALAFTGLLTVVFGNDNFLIDSELNSEALYHTEENLNTWRTETELNFEDSHSTSTTPDGRYELDVVVSTISQCSKSIVSTASWSPTVLRSQQVTLRTALASIEEAIKSGGNCEPFPPASGWDTPIAYGGIGPSDFPGQGTGIAYAFINGRRYALLTTNKASTSTSEHNFFAIDTTDFDPVTGTGIDSASDIFGRRVGTEGLNDVVVAEINSSHYAFVLYNATSTQLRVIELVDPSHPSVNVGMPIVGSATIPNVTEGEEAWPRSIYYFDEVVYVGTNYLFSGDPGENEELHVFEVDNPAIPDWDDSVDVNRNVNDIAVRDDFAYLATGHGGDNTPFKIFDINSNSEVSSFSISDSLAGTALYLLSDTVYLGTERTNSEDNFYRIDVGDENNPTQLGLAEEIDQNNTGITSIVVQWPLAFVALDGSNAQRNFQVFYVGEPGAMINLYPCYPWASGHPFPQGLSDLVYVDDLIFASSRSQLDFKLIWDTADTCG